MNYDKDFLKKLDFNKQKTSFVRITSLNNDEIPLEQIEGRVTSGNLSIQGNSSVRRVCSLTIAANDADTIITDELWSLNTKFKLEIGIYNNVDPSYPDIIWFPQGMYIIQSFSKNESTSSLSVSITGQDKMCRLNGTISGSLPAQHDFGQIEEEAPDGTITLTKLPLRTIIKEAVQEYAQEPPGNIIIKDLPDNGYELYQYIGNEPLYMIVEAEVSGTEDERHITYTNPPRVKNVTSDGEATFQTLEFKEDEAAGTIKIKEKEVKLEDIANYFTFNSIPNLEANAYSSIIKYGGAVYDACVVKIENGDNIGYHQIPLVYNSDLILNAGESITSLLDKIKNMLGNYEYFYDVNGKFIFQKKKDYTQELFSPLNDSGTSTANMIATSYHYKFEDKESLTQISYNPTVANVKNDFIIWGHKKDSSGNDWPIHARYAVDKKPNQYHRLKVDGEVKETELQSEKDRRALEIESNIYIDEQERDKRLKSLKEWKTKQSTFWKNESINTVFMDYPTFQKKIKDELDNPNYAAYAPKINFLAVESGYYTGFPITDFQSNYSTNEILILFELNKQAPANDGTDYYNIKPEDIETRYMMVDWREIIYRMAVDYYRFRETDNFYAEVERLNPEYKQGITKYEQYYTDLFSFWRDIYTVQNLDTNYLISNVDITSPYYRFTRKIVEDPTQLNFWFDFLDTGGQLSQFSVKNIDSRVKVVNVQSVKVIYQEEVPEALFVFEDETDTVTEQDARTIINLPSLLKNFVIRSTRGKSAVETANETAVNYTCLSQTFSVSAIPIYYLEPNTKIYLPEIGDCVLTDIRYTLGQSGMMSLSGSKIIKDWH